MVQAGGAALAPSGYGERAITQNKGSIRSPIAVTLLTFLTCGLYGMITFYSMMSDLRAYLNKDEIVPWHIFVPILGLIILLVKLPGWVTEAKQRAGSRNPQSSGPILYFLLAPYFFTKDMNEVWNPTGS